jgi:hypothetical protein
VAVLAWCMRTGWGDKRGRRLAGQDIPYLVACLAGDDYARSAEDLAFARGS